MMLPTEWIQSWRKFLSENSPLNLQGMDPQLNTTQGILGEMAQDEGYWHQIQTLYPKPENHINLNNGGVCSNALHVEKAFLTFYSMLNTSPSYFTWKVMEKGRETVKTGLACMANASSDEIALFRNATESLNNAIFGIPLSEGDEVVACHQDYIKCVSSWKQRELREKIKISWVELFGNESNEEVIQKYIAAFSPNTKVLHLTHIINWNGQILPVIEISREAKKRGIIVILDAAHSFAVLETDVRQIDCDYMGVALHKWLSGPIASGMLYVKKEMISKTYPLASAIEPLSDKISKFEEMSIQVLPNLLGLGYAIEFHFKISRALKEARLIYLRKFWTDQLVLLKNIKFNVPLNDNQCKAIANFSVINMDPLDIEKELFKIANVHVSAFHWPNLSGVRITPNIYTRIEDIEVFTQAMRNSVLRD